MRGKAGGWWCFLGREVERGVRWEAGECVVRCRWLVLSRAGRILQQEKAAIEVKSMQSQIENQSAITKPYASHNHIKMRSVCCPAPAASTTTDFPKCYTLPSYEKIHRQHGNRTASDLLLDKTTSQATAIFNRMMRNRARSLACPNSSVVQVS